MPTDELVRLGPWPKGENNVAPGTSVAADELRRALNVDIRDDGKPRRRKGYTKILSGVGIHSLLRSGGWTLFVEGTQLKLLLGDDTVMVIGDLGSPNQISYAQVNADIYLTNGENGFVLRNGELMPWALPYPDVGPTTLSLSGFGEPHKTQSMCFTFMNELGEFGSSDEIEFESHRFARVSNIPQHPGADTLIYCTLPDGEEFGLCAEVPHGTTVLDVDTFRDGRKLETKDMYPMPPGRIVREYRGRLYVADGETMFFSDPMHYGLIALGESDLVFDSDITVMEPVNDGIWLVTESGAFFMGGSAPENFQTGAPVDDLPGIPGTGRRVPHRWFPGIQTQHDMALWMTAHGWRLGLSGGIIVLPTEGRMALSKYTDGTVGLIEDNGIRRAVASMRGPGQQSGFVATDFAEAEIRRKGVIIG